MKNHTSTIPNSSGNPMDSAQCTTTQRGILWQICVFLYSKFKCSPQLLNDCNMPNFSRNTEKYIVVRFNQTKIFFLTIV